MKNVYITISLLAIGVGVILFCASAYWFTFRAPALTAPQTQFVVSRGIVFLPTIARNLEKQGIIRSASMFELIALFRGAFVSIHPGGYTVYAGENVWQVVTTLSGAPSSLWVTLPDGARKEQNAEIIAQALSWSDAQKKSFITATNSRAGFEEGVYLPDTYLIPVAESPAQVVQRIQAHFSEVFAPYAKEAAAQNIKWTTAINVASLIQREAAGKDDMAIISGIIWNRLNAHMPLGIDATIQYAVGDKNADGSWWEVIKHADTLIDSPYNTYKHIGLPPTPIDSPNLNSINAAINPAKTTCLYYLHDNNRQIHCSDTYAGQQANVEKYLK